MTPDDVPNPLADVDLDAWQPPEPAMEQVEAIVQRHAGTRTDVAAAIEVTPTTPTRTQRLRWVAAGVLIGAAAAALIAVALWPDDVARDAPVVAPGPPPTPVPDRPAGTIASPRDVADQAALARLERAARDRDWEGIASAYLAIEPDSKYHAAAKVVHDRMRDEFIAAEVESARTLARRGDCKAISKRARLVLLIWKEAADALEAVPCGEAGNRVDVDFDPASCDADALVASAREAIGANDWDQAIELAERANQCKPSKGARQLALMAACRANDRKVALEYRDEFRGNAGMRQICQGLIDMDEASPAPDSSGGDLGGNPYPCDADALVGEARRAGGMNQWSEMLRKAEASIKCRNSKHARQLALMAACRLGNKVKALVYWKEFARNTGMRQVCYVTLGIDPGP
jgi:hypothetical protein